MVIGSYLLTITMASDDEVAGSLTELEVAKAGDKHPPSVFTDSNGNLKFVNTIVAYPCRIFFFVLALCCGTLIILISLTTESPFTEFTNEYDLSDTRSVAYDSLSLAVETVNDYYETISGENTESKASVKIQQETGDTTVWIYEAKTNDGLFTKEALPIMRAAEMAITGNKEYPNYCKLEYTEGEAAKCRKSFSATNIFYASEWNSTVANKVMSELAKDGNVERYDNPTTADDKEWIENMSKDITSISDKWDGEGELNQDMDEVSKFLGTIKQVRVLRSLVQFYLDDKFTQSNPIAMYSRAIVYWGEPLSGSKEIGGNNTDNKSSEKLRNKYISNNLLDKLDEIAKPDNNSEVHTYYFMITLIPDVITKLLLTDGLKAWFSFWAVFFYLRLMIGSWFLATVGMIEIFMSLPLAWFFFSYVLQIKYFSYLNVLCIFIVMAIGADDIFVFMDAYQQSAHKGEEVLKSLETRITWVYRRAGHAMAITSATTCCAFLSTTLTSPIAGTRSFGTFAAFVIFFDYILVMTLYCTAVVIYHDRFENKNGCCNCSFWSKSNMSPTQIAVENKDGEGPSPDRITVFFKETFSQFILKPKNRIIIAIPMIAWIVISSIYTSKLEPTTTTEQILDKDHPLQKSITILDKFPKTQEDNGVPIYFIWGLHEIDRNGVNQLFGPDYIGKPSFVNNFEFNEDCQLKMLEACETLKNDSEFEEFIKRADDGNRIVDCFVEELGAYKVNNATNCDTMKGEQWKSETWQVNPSDLESTMESFVKTKSCYGNKELVQNQYSETMGWDGESLRYAGFSIESSILTPIGALAEDVVRVHYDKFLEFKETLDVSMEKVCQGTAVMTDLDQKFIFMNNQSVHRSSAIYSGLIGVAISFVVLLISTKKFHIALFASINILLVILAVTGSMTILGWSLGSIEAILISILAGFSVDYTVHLAHAYTHAHGDTSQRVKESFGDMGTSVFSGMLTSVVASIPLFFCSLTFFFKFGVFLCITIFFSWIFANLGFMSVLAQFKIPMIKKMKNSSDADVESKEDGDMVVANA